MKIVKFYGGLGNQMFQYAFLLSLREKWHEEVFMDTCLYKTYSLHNGFELDRIFCTSIKKASESLSRRLSRYTTNYRLSRVFHYFFPTKKTEFREWTYGKYYPQALDIQGDMSFEGYWQHWEYFHPYRNILLKEFSLKNPLDSQNNSLYETLLKSDNSVSVHIRRGDYLNKRIYKGLCDVDYYRAAICKAKEIVGKDCHFYFFSNDFNWCKENLSDLVSSEYFHAIDINHGRDSYKDMHLMSACRVNIIANSSFSWWGAYLNKRDDHCVIAPQKWINKKMPNPIQLPDWILL